MQDEASQLVAHVLGARAGERVLDACAAPGSKTTHVAALAGDRARVVAGVLGLLEVLVDRVDVRSLAREDLWAEIGVVPQKAFLFSGTVGSNVRFGKADATEDEIWRALDIAQARDFVEEMDGGLDAEITQGGTNVSGGQRQRLAIARAIVKDAPIYVFDDSFSALDFTTDARLRAALDRNIRRATKIIVAQRVGTILNADQIVVMDAGRVVGIGTHRELLERNGLYAQMYRRQLLEEELEVDEEQEEHSKRVRAQDRDEPFAAGPRMERLGGDGP